MNRPNILLILSDQHSPHVAGCYGDPVVDRRGRVIGKVTSCAVDQEGYLLGQAYMQSKYTAEGTPIAIFQSAPKKTGKAPAELSVGDRVAIPTPATVVSRFLREELLN